MNRKLSVCLGQCRQALAWRRTEMAVDEIIERLREPIRTQETVEQYHSMTKAEKDAAKDRGGFFPGTLKGTRRQASEVVSLSMIAFDCDKLRPGFLEDYRERHRYYSLCYTTHSHLPEAPRARILIPLTRDVSPDERNAIARYLAQGLGMEMVDPCSFRVNQMMYWPTVPSDGEYIFEIYDGDWLDPDAFLDSHPYWKDTLNLPRSAREEKPEAIPWKKQEDPLKKVGVVGDFCRTYSIQSAMQKFLPDIYEPTEQDDRYDFAAGEGRNGVVVYDDKFAYSFHATDPAGGKLLNAFDLVRIHKFGDDKFSYKSMCEFALQDEDVQKAARESKLAATNGEFAPEDSSWDDPLPLSDDELPEFPVDALPPPLRDYALAVSENTQTPVDMAAVTELGVGSISMGNKFEAEPKPGWREPPNIYELVIADSSDRKSSVQKEEKKPLDEHAEEYNAAHRVEIEMSRAQKQRLENQKAALISVSKRKGSDEAAEDFNDKLQDVIEQLTYFKEIKPERLCGDDTTPEKLAETLAEHGGAYAIMSPEGGIFEVLAGAYSNKVNIDVFLKAYSGEDITVERIMRNSVTVKAACLTIVLAAQPKVLTDVMKNKKFRNRGLTARFLYSLPKSRVGSREYDTVPIPEETYEAYKKVIYNILDEKRGPKPEIIRLTDDAKPILEEFYNWVEKKLAGEFSFMNDWLGKLVGNTVRIAAILARTSVIRKNVGDAFLEKDPPVMITAEIMRNAIRIGKYFLAHAVTAYSKMGVESDFRVLAKVLDKIREKNIRVLCRRDLMRACRWISSIEESDSVLSALEDYGYVRLIAVDTSDKIRGGRPKNPTYAVNPKVF